MRDALVQLFWFWAFAALLLTLAIVVVGGTSFLAPSTVQVVIGALLVLTSIHLWNRRRHSDERKHDPRLRRDRERRGY
jgi:membrane protein implicated in regulation of membrane protease activity